MKGRMMGRGFEAGLLLVALAVSPAMTEAAEKVFEGRLASTDLVAPSDGTYYKMYEFRAAAGESMVIDLISSDFDAYLIVHSPSGEVSMDDDGGEGFNSRLSLEADETGTWKIFVNTVSRGEVGGYRLTVRSFPAGSSESQEFPGTLNAGSPKLPTSGAPYNEHVVTLEAGQEITVSLTSGDFDTVLYVHSPSGQSFEDDDGGQGTDSRLHLTTDEAGEWRIVATSFGSDGMGAYTLRLRTLQAE